MRTTSVALGSHFDNFIQETISRGRYNNASEVVRAGLRLLEDDENRILSLRAAIEKGIESGIAEDFDPEKHLQELKARRKNG